jgi:carboxypeptidase Q
MRSLPASLSIDRRFLAGGALLLALVPGLWGQDSPAPEAEVAPALPAPSEVTSDPQLQELIESGRDGSAVQLMIEVVTKHFPKRLTGSSTLKLAQDWARVYFEEMGLEARLEQWGQVEVGFDRGGSKGRVSSPAERSLTFITPAWSPGTLGAVEGPAILEPADLEEFEQRRDEYVGAWLLRNPKVGRRDRRQLDAAYEEHGVVGTIRPGSRDGRLVTGGGWDVEWDDLPTMVRVTLLHEEFAQLSDEVHAAAEAGEDPPLLEFDIDNQFLHGPIPQYNVVADITGSEWPDEYVIVQGHIDAWDGAEGACDNGTGVATTMAVARLLTRVGIQPKRTIRFVLYSGEEQGLYGSRGYVEQHVGELDKISVVFNHDNGTNYLRGISVTSAMLEDFRAVFAPVQRLDPARGFEVGETRGLRPGPSDHSPFVTAGVPAFHWFQAKDGYRRLHHTQYDTLEEVDNADQTHSTLVVAMAAVGFANLDHMVDRSFMREPEPRLMGVNLDRRTGCELERVSPGSLAEGAGWKVGDVILSIDGVEASGRRQLVAELQKGGPKKVIVLARGEERIETELDWSDDPLEEVRRAWGERKAASEEQR